MDNRHKKQANRGVILVITMFLLLIIATLTIAFLYLQFTEVELIADETDYLQAFYLASAGLEQGKKTLTANEHYVIGKLRQNPNAPWVDPNSDREVFLETNKKGRYYHQFELLSDQSNTQIISIQGIGVINDHGRLVKDVYESTSSSGPPSPEETPEPEIMQVFKDLDWTTVVSINEIKQSQQVLFVDPCEDSPTVKTPKCDNPWIENIDCEKFSEKDKETLADLPNTINKITKARYLDKNDNGLIFANKKLNYDSPWLTQINVNYAEFKYTDTRKTLGGKTTIQPTMEVKANQEVILESGTYFFESLTLDTGATIRTNGDVSIYTTALKLETGARMEGSEGEGTNPYNLIILAEYWPGYPYTDKVNRVDIGSGAQLTGIIFAPRVRVNIHKGSVNTETRVNGAIFTSQLIVTGSAPVGWARVACQNMGQSAFGKVPGEWKEGPYP